MDATSPFAAQTEREFKPDLQESLIPTLDGIAADQLSADRARSLALIEGLRRLNLALARQKFAAATVRQEREALTRLRDLLGSH
jgi:hypothetical protein